MDLPSDNELLNEPCVSFWFKKALRGLSDRDVVDAIRDVELLREVLLRRVNTALHNLGCERKASANPPGEPTGR